MTTNKQKTPAVATPMMKQYWAVKRRHPDAILLFRLGDFYETFGEDAVKASKALGIALTSRGSDIPLAGIPFHSVDPYIDRLVAAGYKVAICEQMEDPAKAKGIVHREVVRVITAGTVLSEGILQGNRPNYLAAICPSAGPWGLAIVDLSTGEFLATELRGDNLSEELGRLDPAELLLPTWIEKTEEKQHIWRGLTRTTIEGIEPWVFERESAEDILGRHFGTTTLEGFGLEGLDYAVGAAGAVIHYLRETQKVGLSHIKSIRSYRISEFMHVDRQTRRNLELVESMDPEDSEATLQRVIDKTCTRMGARLLRKWILEPLMDVAPIEARLDAVEQLGEREVERVRLREQLTKMGDVERLAGRIGCRAANPRDLVSLAASLERVSSIRELLPAFTCTFVRALSEEIMGETDIVERIGQTLADQPPATIRHGGFIRPEYDEKLDELKSAAKDGKRWLAKLQQHERETTGIPSLKVGFNKVFGFYIEVTKTHLSKVPDGYIRKQTLANAERFYTAELKEKESLILGAEERAREREQELFNQLLSWLEERLKTIQQIASATARLDVVGSLAQLAQEKNYCRPEVEHSSRIVVSRGRHPVVEELGSEPFVPNDTMLDQESHQIILLTGPNMAGKSTYLRQTGLIILMAQMGSFVPAKSAQIGLTDRIFTRVGASDRLARGQSTFLVEMVETANILHHASDRSLVLLDEIGRGTSTYDGLAIAWAVAEELHEGRAKPFTVFATHYHELTALEDMFTRIKNYNVLVKREGQKVLFLHRIDRGAASSSYGIEVARLAGLPHDVLDRADEILCGLENPAKESQGIRLAPRKANEPQQLEMFGPSEGFLREKLKSIVVEQMTPLQALNVLHELKRLAEKETKEP